MTFSMKKTNSKTQSLSNKKTKPNKHPVDIHTFKHIYFLYFKEIVSHLNPLSFQEFRQISKTEIR